ncbi:MAG: Salicylate hydroxylase [Labilithrix sp.]|nr:Salicylate hydroxylase [Labilithrix sp.]
MLIDTVIVGAGPVGCFLARELRLAGASVVVLEAQKSRSPHSKALTMNCRSLELLDMRGISERFTQESAMLPGAHFAALETRLALSPLDTKHPYTLVLAQRRTEELLEEAARELGADFRFGQAFSGLEQDEAGVNVHVESSEGAYTLRARYLVGCDGARSAVRRASGIAFPGTDTTMTAFQGDVRLAESPQAFSVMNERGGLLIVRQADGSHRVVVTDPARMHVDKDVPPTTDELRDSMKRIAGTDYGLYETIWLSRFGNATRQAESYRRGRVFLAGDAAHIHFPAGGQGMNVGLQDAINLGWKLAATLQGWAPAMLLDSYHDERHAVGSALVTNTRVQEALLGFTPPTLALRALFADLLRNAEINRRLAEDVTGLSVAYSSNGSHRWMGRRLPDIDFMTPNGPSNVFYWLRAGRFVIFDAGLDDATRARLLDGWGDRIIPVRANFAVTRPDFDDVSALLVRPDGHVAWVGTRDEASSTLDDAMSSWCGPGRACH